MVLLFRVDAGAGVVTGAWEEAAVGNQAFLLLEAATLKFASTTQMPLSLVPPHPI